MLPRLFQDLTPNLHHINKYKYVSPQSTPLDCLLNDYWWQPLSEHIPLNIHPNTLTVIALFFSFVVAYWPQQLFAPEADRPCPRIIYLLTALAYFMYQSLDAVDGKQARRTGLSSALGQMMDHGCDALTTFYSAFIICSAIQLGLGSSTGIIVTMISFQLFDYGWYEYRHGVFKTSTGSSSGRWQMGVTEGQWTVIILNLISFLFPNLWTSTLVDITGWRWLGWLTLYQPINILVFYPCVVCMGYINSVEVKSLYKEVTSGPGSSIDADMASKKNDLGHAPVTSEQIRRDWLALGFHLYCQFALCLSNTIHRHPFPVVTIICFAGAQVVWRMMVASLLKMEFQMVDLATIPFYVTSLLAACKAFGTGYVEAVVLWVLALYTVAIALAYAYNSMHTMKTYLNIPLFVVPDGIAQRVATQSAATPKAGATRNETDVTARNQKKVQQAGKPDGAKQNEAGAAGVARKTELPASETELKTESKAPESESRDVAKAPETEPNATETESKAPETEPNATETESKARGAEPDAATEAEHNTAETEPKALEKDQKTAGPEADNGRIDDPLVVSSSPDGTVNGAEATTSDDR